MLYIVLSATKGQTNCVECAVKSQNFCQLTVTPGHSWGTEEKKGVRSALESKTMLEWTSITGYWLFLCLLHVLGVFPSLSQMRKVCGELFGRMSKCLQDLGQSVLGCDPHKGSLRAWGWANCLHPDGGVVSKQAALLVTVNPLPDVVPGRKLAWSHLQRELASDLLGVGSSS